MRVLSQLSLLAGAGLALAGLSAPAAAQATRTWVSGVGDDANPCSRTAPCKTFAGAISKTAANGEINCLDPAGYGNVMITKSVAIVCHYTEGGSAAGGGTAITVNLAAKDGQVLLSGLDLLGSSQGSGIRLLGAGTVHVRDSIIRMFTGGAGLSLEPGATATLIITGSTISGNKTGIAAAGPGKGRIIVGDGIITGNVTGLSASGDASIVSAGNNLIAANANDGRFTTNLPRQ